MFLKNKEIHKACDVNRAHALLMTVFQQCINNKNAQYQIDAGSTGKVTNILLLCNYSSTLDKPQRQLNILGTKHQKWFFYVYTFRQYIAHMVLTEMSEWRTNVVIWQFIYDY